MGACSKQRNKAAVGFFFDYYPSLRFSGLEFCIAARVKVVRRVKELQFTVKPLGGYCCVFVFFEGVSLGFLGFFWSYTKQWSRCFWRLTSLILLKNVGIAIFEA